MTALHLVPTAEIEAEIARREAMSHEERVLVALGTNWKTVGTLSAATELDYREVRRSLDALCSSGRAHYHRRGRAIAYRRAA